MLRIALCSMDIFWHDKEKNLAYMKNTVNFLSDRADIVVFPEMSLSGFSNHIDTIVASNGDIEALKNIVKEKKIVLICGVAVRDKNNSIKGKNQAICIGRNGEILATYTKIHPFTLSNEQRYFTGGDELVIVEICGFKIGLSICYDLRFGEIYAAYTKNGCDIVINIANWPNNRIDHWKTLLKARAIENQIYVIGVNRTGIDGNMLEYTESSNVYDASGEIMDCKTLHENLKVCIIESERTKVYKQKLDSFKDKKWQLYKMWL